MARFKDPSFVRAAFEPYLQPGEQVRHVANAVRQPGMTPDGHVGKITWQALGVKVKYR